MPLPEGWVHIKGWRSRDKELTPEEEEAVYQDLVRRGVVTPSKGNWQDLRLPDWFFDEPLYEGDVSEIVTMMREGVMPS